MAEDAGKERCTVHCRPFPPSTTEQRVTEAFSGFGSVKSVKLRREPGTNAFRGSVYVEFDSEDAALRAVTSPPSFAGTKLQVTMLAEYLAKRALGSGSGAAGGSSHKRHKSDHSPTGRRRAESGAEARCRELEQQNANLTERLAEMTQKLDAAMAREQQAQQKLLSKEGEISSLKGEVAALRGQAQSTADRLNTQYKIKLHELEVQLTRAKDEIAVMKKERERELKKAQQAGQPDKSPLPDDDILLQ